MNKRQIKKLVKKLFGYNVLSDLKRAFKKGYKDNGSKLEIEELGYVFYKEKK